MSAADDITWPMERRVSERRDATYRKICIMNPSHHMRDDVLQTCRYANSLAYERGCRSAGTWSTMLELGQSVLVMAAHGMQEAAGFRRKPSD